MKRKRHTPEEIIKKLRAAEEALAGGKPVVEACRVISGSMATYQRWKSQYGGMKKDALKRLKELKKENTPLKKLVADQALDMAILKEIAEENGRPGPQTRSGGACVPASKCERAPSLPDPWASAQQPALPSQTQGLGRALNRSDFANRGS